MRTAFLALALSLPASAALAQQTPSIEIRVVVVPSTNNFDRFNVLLDGQVPSGWGDLTSGSTGTLTPVSVGQHLLTESAANSSTNLAQYQVAISTSTDGGPWVACHADGTVDFPPNPPYTVAFCVITFTQMQPPPPPVISPQAGAGACPNVVSLSLSDDDPNASIFFTTDGSTPTTSSSQYTTPISVNTTQTITAIAGNGFGTSAAVAETYICPGEAVTCFVFDDDGNLVGPSQAIYISGRQGEQGKACIPDSGPFGICRKWFGQCSTAVTSLPVQFNVWDDDGNSSGPSVAISIPAGGNRACLQLQGSSTIDCRRWFGRAVTSDGRQVSCSVFDDGGNNQAGPADGVYIPHPIPVGGLACIADQTATGTCRRWFGNCTAN
jgi:hypothetical protein